MRPLRISLAPVVEFSGPLVAPDTVVVRARGYAVTSLDTMVDGVHFRSSQLSHEQIGRRAFAAAVSDLGAMAADPGEAFLSLALPRGTEIDYAIEKFTTVVRKLRDTAPGAATRATTTANEDHRRA